MQQPFFFLGLEKGTPLPYEKGKKLQCTAPKNMFTKWEALHMSFQDIFKIKHINFDLKISSVPK